MKLKLFDFIALGVSALGSVLLGISTMRHASTAAIEQVNAAFDEATEEDGVDMTEF